MHLGSGDGQFLLGDFEFSLDLTTLGTVDSVAQLGPQYFDLGFEFGKRPVEDAG